MFDISGLPNLFRLGALCGGRRVKHNHRGAKSLGGTSTTCLSYKRNSCSRWGLGWCCKGAGIGTGAPELRICLFFGWGQHFISYLHSNRREFVKQHTRSCFLHSAHNSLQFAAVRVARKTDSLSSGYFVCGSPLGDFSGGGRLDCSRRSLFRWVHLRAFGAVRENARYDLCASSGAVSPIRYASLTKKDY